MAFATVSRNEVEARAGKAMNLNDDDLPDILEGCRTNDPAAQRRFMSRYQDMVYRTAYYYLWHHHDAEDVAQEVFLIALLKINQLKGSDPCAWLRTITFHECVQVLRKRHAHIPLESVPPPEARPDRSTATAEELEELERALGFLSAEDRLTFLLRHRDGLQYEEIAEAMHCPVGTVKSRLHRAIVQISLSLRPDRGR